MRKLCLTTLAMLPIATAHVFAADLPTMKAPAYEPAPPVFSWSGIYVGGNVGYADSTDHSATDATDPITQSEIDAGTVTASNSFGRAGLTAGGQVGFNYEFPTTSDLGVVAGLEADFAYTGVHSSNLIDSAQGTTNVYYGSLDNLGTARVRIGAAFDRLLVYATGGFAYGYSAYSHVYNSNSTPSFPIWGGGANGERTGFAVGGGVEYALPVTGFGGGTWTVRVEYLYYDLGTLNATLPFLPAPGALNPFIDHDRLDGDLVRVGLNYKFDLFGSPTPVVSKY
jgi:outer membrane immunogenic protein